MQTWPHETIKYMLLPVFTLNGKFCSRLSCLVAESILRANSPSAFYKEGSLGSGVGTLHLVGTNEIFVGRKSDRRSEGALRGF